MKFNERWHRYRESKHNESIHVISNKNRATWSTLGPRAQYMQGEKHRGVKPGYIR